MSPGVLFTVLSNIPWGQVIDNAPKVADGATRLWNSVGALRKKPPSSPAADTPAAPPNVPQTAAQVLQAKVDTLEVEVHQLSGQMQASTELIKALADQNAQLVQRIELNRVRLRQWALAVGVTAAGLVVAVGSLWLRA